MDPILQKAYEEIKKGRKCVFATVIEASRGTPRKIGAKMAVFGSGGTFGTIGGGKVEKEVIIECKKALKKRKPSLLTFNLTGRKDDPVCGGRMKVFIEPVVSALNMIICGAGHIALPLSIICKILNFKVTIIDDRKELANKTRFPHVDKIIVGNHAENLSRSIIGKDTFILVMTQGHKFDFECLKSIIKSGAGYIGVIASKNKSREFRDNLKKLNIPARLISRIHMPVGLDIGAQTPEEIAVSISAQIVGEYNKEYLKADKFK